MKISEQKGRDWLPEYLNERGLTGFGAEVGVHVGRNAEVILSKWEGRGLFLIDPYRQFSMEEYPDLKNGEDFKVVRNEAHDRLRLYGDKCIWLEMTSEYAALMLNGNSPPLDFVYIDANHTYDAVYRDIRNYHELIKPGGLLCGHDYHNKLVNGNQLGVKRAVDEFADEEGLTVEITEGNKQGISWWIEL